MAYCVKCGAMVDDGVKFCPQCGAQIPVAANAGHSENTGSYQYQQGYGQQEGYGYQNQSYTYAQNSSCGQQGSYVKNGIEYFDAEEVKQNKAMGVLSYIGILVLIPLIAGNKKSEYVRLHINQGLILFVVSSVVDLMDDWLNGKKAFWGLYSMFSFGDGFFSWIFDILGLAFFIFMVVGIVTAAKGEKRELPIIGKLIRSGVKVV